LRRRRPEARDEFAAAVDADLREDGLEVIVQRVAGDGEALGGRSRVEAGSRML
jgi:hypothetical protein